MSKRKNQIANGEATSFLADFVDAGGFELAVQSKSPKNFSRVDFGKLADVLSHDARIDNSAINEAELERRVQRVNSFTNRLSQIIDWKTKWVLTGLADKTILQANIMRVLGKAKSTVGDEVERLRNLILEQLVDA